MIKPHSAAILLLLACGCSQTEDSDKIKQIEGEIDSGNSGSPPKAEAISKNAAEEVHGKVDGTYTVLGLVIPLGMKPVKAPEKVFRFQGFVGVPDAIEAIKAQIRPKWTRESATGVGFREARVRVPQGAATGRDLLDIRVYRSPKGAAMIDVSVAHSGDLKNTAEQKLHRTKSQGSSYQHRRLNKAGKETMRVLDKRSRGQKPSKNDQNSPFYY